MLEQSRAIHSQSYQSNEPAPLTRCLRPRSEIITQHFNAPLCHYRQANNDVLHRHVTSHTRESHWEGLERVQGALGANGMM